MRLVYGTNNPAKLSAMRSRLAGLNIELIGLEETDKEIPVVEEKGKNPIENAKQKAFAYYKALKEPVFSCDTGLYFDNTPEKVQPGVHVRNINGKCLNDDEMITYYSGLAKEYGNLVAQYRNAICLILDENHIYSAMEESMASEPFIITSKPHPQRQAGFPIDSISIDIKTGKYYFDLDNKEVDTNVENGFFKFIKNILTWHKQTGTLLRSWILVFKIIYNNTELWNKLRCQHCFYNIK